MRNIWTIARRELSSYFASPIAYIVLAMFAVIFGFFFYSAVAIFVQFSAQAAMQQPGMAPPMNVNQFIIQPTLGNFSIILLLLTPLITMRLFAEEQRSGTLELLLTSPMHDYEIILGKWLGSMLLYACMLAVSLLNFSMLFIVSTPDWRAHARRLCGPAADGRRLHRDGGLHFDSDAQPDRRRRADLLPVSAAVGARLGRFL